MLCGGVESAWNYVGILDFGLFQALEQSYARLATLRSITNPRLVYTMRFITTESQQCVH